MGIIKVYKQNRQWKVSKNMQDMMTREKGSKEQSMDEQM
jgi:hypothetical protein